MGERGEEGLRLGGEEETEGIAAVFAAGREMLSQRTRKYAVPCCKLSNAGICFVRNRKGGGGCCWRGWWWTRDK